MFPQKYRDLFYLLFCQHLLKKEGLAAVSQVCWIIRCINIVQRTPSCFRAKYCKKKKITANLCTIKAFI